MDDLNISHCKHAMDRDLLIGVDKTKDHKSKRFVFNAWENEYRVKVGTDIVDAGQAIEELLEVYNEL